MHEPTDEEGLAALVRDARDSESPLAIQGGNTRAGFGRSVDGTPLTTRALTGITLYEPGALTLVARAGTPLSEIESAVAAEGQMLPFEAPLWARMLGNEPAAESTIGGVVATNASGPRRILAGACRDSLIGVRFVDGSGRVLKNGGRVMKNVTGYDLVKLMCGSHGTLGVLTEVSLKLLPAPQKTVTLSIHGLDDVRAVRAMSAALGSPFNVSGATHSPQGARGDAMTCLRLEGLSASVDYRAAELANTLAEFGALELDEDAASVQETWRSARDVKVMAASEGSDVWRVSTKPSDGPAVAAKFGNSRTFYDWGGGLVWLAVESGTDVRRELSGVASGHATLFRASDETREALGVFEPEVAPLAKISEDLRHEFDPAGVLNRARMASARTVAAA